MFELSRQSPKPLVDQIVERLSGLIREGRLGEGTRLPSIRKLASLSGASPFTVVDAYDRLVARGMIASRAGRGFYVAARVPNAALAAIEATGDPGSDAVALAYAALTQPAQTIAAGSGFLPAQWLMEIAPGTAAMRLARGRRPQAFMPCPPQGLPELREQIAAKLLRAGIVAAPANLLITFGASHAFDLIARALLAPGDAVLVEDPGYFVLFEQLRAHHVRLVPIPRLPDGPDLEALEAACRAHRPRAFFLQTLLHNPSGSSIEPAHCHRLLSLAERYGVALIEDDVYGDLYEGAGVRLAQIDGLRHVIHVASFSKLIGPALRVGFIAAERALIGQLVQRKMLTVLSGSALLESFIAEVLDGGRYGRHVEQIRVRLARMRRDARAALVAAGIVFDEERGGGIFLWGRVPEGTDTDRLVQRAQEASILLAKGSLFSASGSCRERLRFNAAHSTAPELASFLRGALKATV
jgi:DNA-binding transcriptional MocR family regulator